MNALLNVEGAREVVRWGCFRVFAGGEGRGYIHKAILDEIQKRHRVECTGPNAIYTISMIKALNDAFDIMALEEEQEYATKVNTGKRKKKKRNASSKLPAPPSNQNSIIPLSIRRRSHIDYTTFCRYFDKLPQLSAAFMHVWLPLLFTDRLGEPNHDTSDLSDNEDGKEEAEALFVENSQRLRDEQAKKNSLRFPGDQEERLGSTGESPLDAEVEEPNSEKDDVVGSAEENISEELNDPLHGTFHEPLWETKEYPLQLLGANLEIRHATLKRLVYKELDLFQKAVDILGNYEVPL
ncbi:unnamed protein product [Phytomonas sp. Hart1]|nr:unnamed protein product [Phytomonas sp. Hart1]|eukprot:CCW66022.1 unnamed protein product [Phytomonas sp. isolate Hart1]